MREFVMDHWKVYIADSVLEIIGSFRQIRGNDNESGGILIGQVKDDCVYILKATTPNRFDKASKNNFVCNKDISQILIDHEFRNSERRSIYIGEWHTHPEDKPTPSSVDLQMITNQFARNVLNEPFLILLIQGLRHLYVGLFDGRKLKHLKLKK